MASLCAAVKAQMVREHAANAWRLCGFSQREDGAAPRQTYVLDGEYDFRSIQEVVGDKYAHNE